MAATESDGATLHREFCEFLLAQLRHTDPETGARTLGASMAAVIRAFLKDNSITAVPDPVGADPLSELSRQFHNSSPPRMRPELDLDPDEVH